MCSGSFGYCLCLCPWSLYQPSYAFCVSRALSPKLSLALLIPLYTFFVSCIGGGGMHKKEEREKKKPQAEDTSKAKVVKEDTREERKEEAKPKKKTEETKDEEKKDPKGKSRRIVAEDDAPEEVLEIKAEPARMAALPRHAPRSTYLEVKEAAVAAQATAARARTVLKTARCITRGP